MATVAVRGLAEGADSANAHRPLIEDRRKVVLRGAGKHVGTPSASATVAGDGSVPDSTHVQKRQ
jgi:hypothetical protein